MSAPSLDSIASHRATLFEGVPTMYFYLLNFPELDRYDLSCLRLCTVGGQTMPVAKMEEVEQRFGCPLIELWGMTELAGLATTFRTMGRSSIGSIGVPLPHCRAKIVHVDDARRSCRAGEAGELMISGPLVMQGYCGNPQATRETIEPDGWLHTGDIAKIDADGFIYIVDRKKDMILTAGFNVYPAELERVIAGHPHVAMVAVGPSPTRPRVSCPRRMSCRSPARRPLRRKSSSTVADIWPRTRSRERCSSSTTCRRQAPARSCVAGSKS